MRLHFLFCLGVTVFHLQAQTGATNLTLNLRVAGSSVVDSKGELAGNIESIVIDPRSSRIYFALVSTEYPSNRFNVTPVPWDMLQYRWDARAAGGVPGTSQQFVVPMDRLSIARAPRINSEFTASTNDLVWMNATYSYFHSAMGGTKATAPPPKTP